MTYTPPNVSVLGIFRETIELITEKTRNLLDFYCSVPPPGPGPAYDLDE